MYQQLHNILAAMERDQQLTLLAGNRIGIEKEALRVDVNGSLSQLAHPKGLGLCFNQPIHYHRLFRSLVRVDHTTHTRREKRTRFSV